MNDQPLSHIVPYINTALLFLISIIGWLVKNQLGMIVKRIDNHDEQIIELLTTVSGLVAIVGMRTRHRSIESIDGMESQG